MQKIEYSCDRCGASAPAERMWKFQLARVYVKSDSTEEPKPREILDHLERYWKANVSKEFCENCVASFTNWLEQGR